MTAALSRGMAFDPFRVTKIYRFVQWQIGWANCSGRSTLAMTYRRADG
jgi:hypothetical protein